LLSTLTLDLSWQFLLTHTHMQPRDSAVAHCYQLCYSTTITVNFVSLLLLNMI